MISYLSDPYSDYIRSFAPLLTSDLIPLWFFGVVESHCSYSKSVSNGVRQGSVLCPTLSSSCMCYINVSVHPINVIVFIPFSFTYNKSEMDYLSLIIKTFMNNLRIDISASAQSSLAFFPILKCNSSLYVGTDVLARTLQDGL